MEALEYSCLFVVEEVVPFVGAAVGEMVCGVGPPPPRRVSVVGADVVGAPVVCFIISLAIFTISTSTSCTSIFANAPVSSLIVTCNQ